MRDRNSTLAKFWFVQSSLDPLPSYTLWRGAACAIAWSHLQAELVQARPEHLGRLLGGHTIEGAAGEHADAAPRPSTARTATPLLRTGLAHPHVLPGEQAARSDTGRLGRA
jgi:hypothetical protein